MIAESNNYKHEFTHLSVGPEQPIPTVQIYLYEKITNPLEIIDMLNTKKAKYAFLNPKIIVSIKELLIGLNRIFASSETLTTKSLIYYLSPESAKPADIESFKVFDYQKPSIFILQTSPMNSSEPLISEEIELNIKGLELQVNQIGTFINLDCISKMYNISQDELELDTEIRGSIYNIIATKKQR